MNSPKPYYQDEWTTIYNEDCRKMLSQLSRFDLVLTDPPYGVRDDAWDDKLEFNHFVQEWIDKCLMLAPIVIWFGSDNRLSHLVSDKLHRLLIWNKPPGTQYAGASHNNI